jgi:MSHA biogenesis protein MshI
LRSAVRWKIKDLLDMKIDDAAIDVFQVPEDAYRGREMVYVVASLKSKVKSIAELVTGSGLELAVIDIPELVMKNISTSYIDDSNGVAFMDLRRTGSTMNISRDDGLYLTRRINTQLDPGVMQAPDWDTLKDRLVLEIQRSLDYYESQMGKSPINRIIIAPRQHDSVAMAESLNEMLSAQVSVLDLAGSLESAVEFTPEMQQICLPVIGATLRGAKRSEKRDADSEEAA